MIEWQGEDCFCGQIKIVSIDIDMFRPKDDDKKYVILMNMPGYKSKSIGRYRSIESAKDTANRYIKNWLIMMELRVDD